MKSSQPLQIFLERMDSSAPSLSSLCETRHEQWQLRQMFSHKAQMGRADKHQLSAESTQKPSPLAVTKRSCNFLHAQWSPLLMCTATLKDVRATILLQKRLHWDGIMYWWSQIGRYVLCLEVTFATAKKLIKPTSHFNCWTWICVLGDTLWLTWQCGQTVLYDQQRRKLFKDMSGGSVGELKNKMYHSRHGLRKWK